MKNVVVIMGRELEAYLYGDVLVLLVCRYSELCSLGGRSGECKLCILGVRLVVHQV